MEIHHKYWKIILIFSYVYNFKLKRLSGNERHYTSKNLIIYGNKDTRNKNIIQNREENGQFILNSYKPLTKRRFKKTDVSQKDQRWEFLKKNSFNFKIFP